MDNLINSIEESLQELEKYEKPININKYHYKTEETLTLGTTFKNITTIITYYVPKSLVEIILFYTQFYDYMLGLYKMDNLNYFDKDYKNKNMILNSDKIDINLCFQYKDELNELYDTIISTKQWESGPYSMYDYEFSLKFNETTNNLIEYNGKDKSYIIKIAYLRNHNNLDSISNYISYEYSNMQNTARNIFMGCIDGQHYDIATEIIKKITDARIKEICVQYVCLNGPTNIAMNMIDSILIKNKRNIVIFCGKTIEWQKYIDCANKIENNDLLKYIEICKKNDEEKSSKEYEQRKVYVRKLQEEGMKQFLEQQKSSANTKDIFKNIWNKIKTTFTK
jgi:hypothetical protein